MVSAVAHNEPHCGSPPKVEHISWYVPQNSSFGGGSHRLARVAYSAVDVLDILCLDLRFNDIRFLVCDALLHERRSFQGLAIMDCHSPRLGMPGRLSIFHPDYLHTHA